MEYLFLKQRLIAERNMQRIIFDLSVSYFFTAVSHEGIFYLEKLAYAKHFNYRRINSQNVRAHSGQIFQDPKLKSNRMLVGRF